MIVTCGDPNGIGPEISVKAISAYLCRYRNDHVVFVLPKNLVAYIHQYLHPAVEMQCALASNYTGAGSGLTIITTPKCTFTPGNCTRQGGAASLVALETAKKLLHRGVAKTLITAPISKEAIHAAGSEFPGHTEMLASWYATDDFVMMFHSRIMTGALLTIHVPLHEVRRKMLPGAIKRIHTVHQFLQRDLGLKNPRIALLGVNPHAGENGLIGKEDGKLKALLEREGIVFSGPFSADGFFGAGQYKNFDCVISAYHDQLLIPFKMLSMKDGTNITAGLPIVRTSPDHGTAYQLAGKGIADHSSMLHAMLTARKITRNRLKMSHV